MAGQRMFLRGFSYSICHTVFQFQFLFRQNQATIREIRESTNECVVDWDDGDDVYFWLFLAFFGFFLAFFLAFFWQMSV